MAKRANGEGTVTRLPSGHYRARVVVAGTRHSQTFAKRADAERWRREMLGNADKGILPPAEHPTLAQHLDRWLSDVVPGTVRPRTVAGYRDIARLHIVPTLGDVLLTQLQPSQVQRLYRALSDAGLAPRSVRNVHAVLRRALGQAVDWNLVPRNVATLAHPPRAAREEVVALDGDQARRLRDAVRGDRWEALIAMALATGMRQGELLGLRWGDVDLARGTVRVARQLGRDGTFAEPKTSNGRRTIDLPAPTVALLREHKRRQAEERLLVGPDWDAHNLVLCTHRGRPLGQRNVLRAFKVILRRAGLPDVPFHALRHTHATLLFLRGEHPKVVQERLGHATVAMTLDIYSAYIPSMGQEAAAKLAELLA